GGGWGVGARDAFAGQQRCPADVVRVGRDRFVLLPRDPPPPPAGAPREGPQQAARPPSPTPYDPRNDAAARSCGAATPEPGSSGGGGSYVEEFAAGGLAPAITYTRLEAGGPAADQLSGLYIGSFGAHGPELLRLERGADEDGEEVVTGYKVTGDENVPAGQVSFRARVGRRHRLDTRAHYPEDMGVAARYAGEGRIADPNYANAKWVGGELLLFGPGSNPLITGGARVGFVWSVPNDRRFLILLNRIQLE
ncbi:MAG: hypothetical protein J3K34DRAFT_127360, partial [Monoraphidium minutum]